MNRQKIFCQIEPQLIERRCGGWLAVSPRSVAIRIGATGKSEAEARSNFAALVHAWEKSRREDGALTCQQARG